MDNKKKNNLPFRAQSQSGVAILMVLVAITLLTFLLSEIKFETFLNKTKIDNLRGKLQARLNAESGLILALSQLRIYKEARDTLEKNKALKKQISPSMLEGLVTKPFKIPIPLGKGAGGLQKSALADFEKELLIIGDLFVQCNPVTGFLNPNALRLKRKMKRSNSQSSSGRGGDPSGFECKLDDRYDDQNENFDETNNEGEGEDEDEDGQNEDKRSIAEIIESDLTKTLANLLEQKKETDEDFEDKYGDLEAFKLIRELKYFVRAKGDMPESQKAEVDANYMNVSAKHAPMTSLSELYTLQGWPDAVVDLFKDRLSVHQVTTINLNKITLSQLKALFPELSEDQLSDFFKYRDGSPEDKMEPQPFNSEEDFKNYLVKELSGVDESTYKERKKILKKAKVSFGVAGNLFRCISEGKFGKSTYKLESFINIPLKEPTDKEVLNYKKQLCRWKKGGRKGAKPTLPPPKILDPRVVEVNII